MKINAYCANWGWLFEDFKRDFAAHRQPGVEVVASDLPVDADAWICIRTDEALASPDPARTVVQVHDLREHGAVWRRRFTFGALSLVSDMQLPLWRTWRPTLLMPIGARRLFTLRESMPLHPTVGWVGRDIIWQGRHIKHPEVFVEAVNLARKAIPDLRATMYGPKLEHYAEACGAEHVYGDRAESLRDWYHGIDLLCITAEPEPGPLSKWEALACGVPWQEATEAKTMADIIVGHSDCRAKTFAAGRHYRAMVPTWQDEWIAANVNLALEIAR